MYTYLWLIVTYQLSLITQPTFATWHNIFTQPRTFIMPATKPVYQWCGRSVRRGTWRGPPTTWTRCTALFWSLRRDIAMTFSLNFDYLWVCFENVKVMLWHFSPSSTHHQLQSVRPCDGVNMPGAEHARVWLVRLGRDVADSRRQPQGRAPA